MASADRGPVERINELLDAQAAAARADELGRPTMSDPDPVLTETLRRLRALDAAEPLDQASVARMWGELIRDAAPVRHDRALPTATVVPSLNGQVRPRALAAPLVLNSVPRTHPWRGIAILAAALLLLAFGAGYLIVGPGFDRGGHPKLIPAASVPDTPTPTPINDVVLEYTIAASDVPRGSIGSGTTRNTIPPGNRSTWTPYCCPGPMLEYVMAGSYTVRAQAAIRVVRANGTNETVPAGVEVTLGPGDALISRNETVVEAINGGTETVQLLNWTLIQNAGFSGHLLAGWTNNHPDVKDPITLPDGPVTVRLRRIELAPGDGVPPPAEGVYQFIVPFPVNAGGTPVADTVWSMMSPALNPGTEPMTVYLLEVEPASAAATPVAQHSTP